MSILSKSDVSADWSNRPKRHTPQACCVRHSVVYEDENIFVYEKPNKLCFQPWVKTLHGRQGLLGEQDGEQVAVSTLSTSCPEASGLLVVAKSREWRQHLQEHWGSLPKACTSWWKVTLRPTTRFVRPEMATRMSWNTYHAGHGSFTMLVQVRIRRSGTCCRR